MSDLTITYCGMTAKEIMTMKAYVDRLEARVNELENTDVILDNREIAPAKTPVDLSVLVNSGVDCEFWDGNEDIKFFGMLNNIISDEKYRYIDREESWPYCQPRMNHWMSPRNDNEAVMWDKLRDAGFIVHVAYDNFGEVQDYAVEGVQDGRCMPWEVEK